MKCLLVCFYRIVPRSWEDDDIEEELHRLFGLPDDADISEDDSEPESENVTDVDLRNMLRGIKEDLLPLGSEIEVPYQVAYAGPSTSSFPDPDPKETSSNCRNDERTPSPFPSNSSFVEQPSENTAEVQSSSPSLHSGSRRRRINSSSPEVPSISRRNAPTPSEPSATNSSPLSDTDESDTEETQWKKVLWAQNPNLELFVSVKLESRQFTPSRTRPVTYFTNFFGENVINLLVVQTIIYAEQQRSRSWTSVDAAEIKAFIGMVILMGLPAAIH